MRIPFGKPMLGMEEKEAVSKVLDSGILVHGPVAEQFENVFSDFTGAPYCVSVSSCTSGMHLIYFALGYGPGDEVLVPAQTHIATAHAVELTGAKAIFVDAESQHGNIDIDRIEEKITPRTRAIAVVHYLGVPADMPAIKKIAEKHGLFLLEDCALAHGARINGKHAGLHGHAGVFSFYPVKHMTSGEGGMVITTDGNLARKIKHLRAFGVDRTHSERSLQGWYDTTALGFNYRMSEIHAAIGVEQTKKLPGFLEKRKENFEALAAHLSKTEKAQVLGQPYSSFIQSSFYCLGLLLDSSLAHVRHDIMNMLKERGVGTSIYYPQPVPRMKYYAEKYGYDPLEFPNAEKISNQIITLPVGPHLDLNDMRKIAEEILIILEKYNVV